MLSHFKAHLCVSYSPRTVELYTRALGRLDGQDLDQLTTADLEAHIAGLRASGAGDATIRVTISALRHYYRWRGVEPNPAKPLRYPPDRTPPQRTITPEQAEALLAACDTSTVMGRRDLALLCVLLDTGLRASEVCRLAIPFLEVVERRLSVTVKGGQIGYATFSEYTACTLAAWLAVRPAAKTEHVFIGLKRRNPLTRRGLNEILSDLGARAGVQPISAHDFRRGGATMATLAGCPMHILMAAWRWKDERTARRYLRAIGPDAVDPYSPVRKVMGL